MKDDNDNYAIAVGCATLIMLLVFFGVIIWGFIELVLWVTSK